MANLPETSAFDAGVYQLETTDPVQGGAAGLSNTPLKNLANRTKYLKDHLDAIENGTYVPTGLAVSNSPTFTGDPKAPTPALGDADTSISTTDFVQKTVAGFLSKSVAGGVNVTLTTVEAGNGIWNFTGTLTANIAVIVPNVAKKMLVMNRTSGAYTLTVKTAAGTGIVVLQGKQQDLACDGVNVFQPSNDMADVILDGAPTLTNTPALFDNSQKLINSAFVQRALGNLQGATQLGVGVTQTLAASDVGKYFQMQGGTITLPTSTGIPVGSTFLFSCSANTTLNALGSERIYAGSTSYASLSLANGDCFQLTLLTAGTSGIWEVTAGIASGTAGQFDNSTRIANTAFVQRALGNINGVDAYVNAAAGPALVASQAGRMIILSGTANGTIYLPLLSTLPEGAAFTFRCESTGAWNVATGGGDGNAIIAGASGTNAVAVPMGDSLTLVKNGSIWRAYGTALLRNSGRFAVALGASGYQVLPSGLIIQWGGASNSNQVITYPLAFPSACYCVVGSEINSSGGGQSIVFMASSVGTTTFTSQMRDFQNNVINGVSIRWIAIGS
jgi:hypothetical protein